MSEPTPEDRAAAQKFAADNASLNVDGLKVALQGVYGDAWQAGALTGAQQTGATLIAGLDGVVVPGTDAEWATFWDKWQPGNAAAGDKLAEGGLADLLSQSGATIKGIEGATLDRLGSILADGVANGASIDDMADRMAGFISDPTRAFSIANTETARAVTAASLDQYAAAGVTKVDWLVSPDACDECQSYADDSPYAIEDLPDLPAHPNCRCSSSPVDPGATGAIPTDDGSSLSNDLADAAVAASDASRLEDVATFTTDTTDTANDLESVDNEAGSASEDEGDSNNPIAQRDLTKLSDDDVAALIGKSQSDADRDAVLNELDRRDDVDRQAAADAQKKAAAKVKRDAKAQVAREAKDAAYDAAIDAGQDPADAYSDIYGVSAEQQSRDQAIASLRANGYTGANFDQLSRAGFKDQVERLYIEAEDATRGAMLNPAGIKAGINPRDLIDGTEAKARKYASEELLDHWTATRRLTLSDYRAGLLGSKAQAVGYWR